MGGDPREHADLVGLVNAYCKLWEQGSRYERLLALPPKEGSGQVERSRPRRARQLPPDRAAALVERYLDGEEVVPLARSFGIDRVTVYNVLENAGVPRRRRCITAEQRDEAIRLYAEGLSVAKVAARLDCSYHGLYGVLKRAGVELRDRHWRAPKG